MPSCWEDHLVAFPLFIIFLSQGHIRLQKSWTKWPTWCDPGSERWLVVKSPPGDSLRSRALSQSLLVISEHPHPLISTRVTFKLFSLRSKFAQDGSNCIHHCALPHTASDIYILLQLSLIWLQSLSCRAVESVCISSQTKQFWCHSGQDQWVGMFTYHPTLRRAQSHLKRLLVTIYWGANLNSSNSVHLFPLF